MIKDGATEGVKAVFDFKRKKTLENTDFSKIVFSRMIVGHSHAHGGCSIGDTM
jgi:hypothetical protein